MMAKLIFRLPEETEEFKLAQNGSAYSAALSEIAEAFRRLDKYGDCGQSVLIEHQDETYVKLEHVREVIRTTMNEYIE